MMDVLYLFVSTAEAAVKIGISRNPLGRVMQLPNKIDLSRSYAVHLRSGSALQLERTLHYWFRADSKQMSPGEGCTEWFQPRALPEIIEFLNANTIRLGVERIEVFTAPAPTENDLKRAAQAATRKAKLERKHAREAERAAAYAVALAGASKQNREAIAFIRAKFEELRRSCLFAGMLPPVHGQRFGQGQLYLKGTGSRLASDELMDHRTSLQSPGGWSRVFGGSFSTALQRIEHIRISVSDDLFRAPDESERQMALPRIEELREFMLQQVTSSESSSWPALIQLRRKLDVEEARFRKAIHEHHWGA